MDHPTAARRVWDHLRRPLRSRADVTPSAPPPVAGAGALYAQATALVTDHFRRATVGGLAVATVIGAAGWIGIGWPGGRGRLGSGRMPLLEIGAVGRTGPLVQAASEASASQAVLVSSNTPLATAKAKA